MRLERNEKKLTEQAKEIVEDCRVSQAERAAAYRQYAQWIETGRAAGSLALGNLLYGHVDRLASHLFSPTELRFAIDYESKLGKDWLDKGAIAARVVSREWERRNVDILFGHGVKESLSYGCCLLKQLAGRDADGNFQYRGSRLVMPWNFGVYDETTNSLSDQEAVCETVYLNKHQVWRRVRQLPDAEKLYKTIIGGSKEEGAGTPQSFMHQVLSTAVLNTSLENSTQPRPGGIVQLSNDASYATLGPTVSPDLYPMHEIYVRDDGRDGGEDYTTIQLIAPGILVAPLLKHSNLFVKEHQPYTLIQGNFVANYIWGRSEIADLMMLQAWLTEHLDDAKRLMGQQIDKLLAFISDGITDEQYGQFRAQGYMAMPPGSDVKDLTPKMPEQLIPLIGEIIQMMDRVSGFPPIMSGQGEPGVRAGVHADTLMKTGSPRLRDRSLLYERDCNAAADTTLAILEAKDAKAYWTDPNSVETEFLISQLPNDRRIAVDSHSSSPIYHDDHANLLAWGVKSGIITGESAIEQLPFAHKDVLIERLKAKEAAQQKLMQEHPEFFTRGGGRGGGQHLRAV